MVAFHGKQSVKELYLARILAHEAADEIIKGTYWRNGKGCAVGCTIHSAQHADYERELGIPQLIARLEDGIFEALPNGTAKSWPRRFLAAIKPGADLSLVWPQFAEWMLADEKWGVLQFAKTDAQRETIQAVADFYSIVTTGEQIDIEDWREVRAAADAAADADAYAAARQAAYAAAYAAARQAAYAAAAAARQAAAYDKKTEWRTAQSEKLLELLQAAK